MLRDLYTKKEFDKLSNKEQRIAIAKDVLANLERKKIKPHKTVYFVFDRIDIAQFDGDADVQHLIETHEECHVCGIGAMLYSVISSYNSYSVSQLRKSFIAPLVPYFSVKELVQIETVFEGELVTQIGLLDEFEEHSNGWIKDGVEITDKDFHDALDYRKSITKSPEALISNIMMNILQHDGQFIVKEDT